MTAERWAKLKFKVKRVVQSLAVVGTPVMVYELWAELAKEDKAGTPANKDKRRR